MAEISGGNIVPPGCPRWLPASGGGGHVGVPEQWASRPCTPIEYALGPKKC